jgi:hypothetical protein
MDILVVSMDQVSCLTPALAFCDGNKIDIDANMTAISFVHWRTSMPVFCHELLVLGQVV